MIFPPGFTKYPQNRLTFLVLAGMLLLYAKLALCKYPEQRFFMGPVWRTARKGGAFYGPFDDSTGRGVRCAALRTALPQPRRRDADGGDLGRDPDARQAAAGGRAFRLGEHGGRGLSDAGGGGLSGGAGAQRLLCTGISGPARADRVRRAAPARGSASAGAARPLRPLHPGRRPGAVSVPHMGAAAKRAAVLFAGAADPR